MSTTPTVSLEEMIAHADESLQRMRIQAKRLPKHWDTVRALADLEIRRQAAILAKLQSLQDDGK